MRQPDGDIAREGRSGSLLIGLIITLAVIAIAGASVAYLTNGSMLTGLLKNNNLQAYYLAESGVRFAGPLMQQDLNSGNQDNMKALFGSGLANTATYTLSTGQFALSVSNVNASSATLTSIGTSGSGWLLTRRQDIMRITASTPPPYKGQSNFSDLKTNWGQTTNMGGILGLHNPLDSFTYDSKNNGIQYESKGPTWTETGGLLTFSASNQAIQSLWQAWLAYGNLSYELQEKVTVDNIHSNFFMIGLSFRVNESGSSNTPKSFYGLSFFRKNDNFESPLWWQLLVDNNDVNEFASLDNDTLYMVFWEYLAKGQTAYVAGSRQTCNSLFGLGNGCFYLLDYSPLTGVVTANGKDLLPGSAIEAGVLDNVSGGTHTNAISAWVAQANSSSNPYYYPVGASTGWPPGSQFYPVTSWTSYTSGHQTATPLIDNSLTPGSYFSNSTAEVGVNVFYDLNGANGQNGGIKDLITDFGMGILPAPGSGAGGQGTQYY